MKVLVGTLWAYAALLLGVGISAYLSSGAFLSLVLAVFLAGLFIFLSARSRQGHLAAGYVGGIFVFLLAVFFAYRLLATERFVPNGILLVVTFLALFGVTLGVFLGLQDPDEKRK